MSDTELMYTASLDASRFASGAQSLNSHLHQMGINTSAASANLGGLGTLLGTLANPLTLVALGITAIGGALVGSAQAAAAWESSMTGVAKTTGLAGPELQKLSQDLLQMSTTVPLAASELASIAAAGGSLGIAGDQLAGFTEVAAQMGVGFEMAADQAATAGAKILNAFGKEMSVDNLRSLGSVVNTMGDSFAATEPQVLEFLNRASFLNATMGQSIPQVAALGTTLISTGLEAEVAATGIKSMLNMLTSETSKTGGMDNWAKLMGKSVDELKQSVATDLNSTLIETANKIAAIEDPVERFQAAVTAAGSEGAPALLKLAGQQDNYTKALGLTNSEWEKASSLQKTFDAQAGTVNSQWTMFTNTLTMAATQFGTGLLPAIGEGIGFMNDLLKISMKVVEVLNDMAGGDLLGKMWDSMPIGMLSNAIGGSETVQGWWSDTKEWAGIGTAHAEEMAKEIAESDKLQKAGAEGLQAGIDAGVLKDPAKNAANEFSKEFVEAFKTAQADREIAKVLARSGNAALTTNKGNIAGTATTTLENGLEVEVAYQGNDDGIYSRLFIDGQQIGDGVYGANREAVLSTLLSKWKYDQANILDLTGRTGEAAVLRAEQKLEFQFDYIGISDIFGSQFASRLENEGGRIATSASKSVQDAYQSLLDALKEPAWDNLDEILGQMDALIAEHELDPLEASLWSEKYKEVLVSGIVDISEFAKSQAEDLNSQIADAFSDFDFSESDRKLVLAMKPMLDAVKAESPKAFGESGLAGIDKFIEMVESGASSSELFAYFKTLGTTAGRSFAEAMNSNFGEIDFDWNKMWGNDFLSSLSDLDAFAENMFQPELIDLASDALERYNTGTDEYVLQAEQMIDNAEILAEKNKWLFTDEDYDALVQYKNNTMSLGTVLSILADEADDSSQGVKKFTKEVEDADTECGKLLSTFGAWQELNSSLWRPEYIGPSFGKEYDNALIANAAYSYVASAASQRYTDSLNGVINAKSEELRVSELLLEKAHAGTLTDEDLALAVRTYGVELTTTNEKAETLAETLGNFNNEFQGDITSTISFDSDLPQHNEIVSTLTLDTVTALSEYESFRANIEGTTITAKLSTQIETTADRISSKLPDIGFEDERTATRRISFKTATPGLGNQTGVGEQDASTGLLQSIYLGLNQNTNRLVAALNSNGASDRTLIRTNTSTISTAVANASSTITSAVNNGAAAIVSAIQDMSNGCGSGINVGSVGGASSSESYFSTTTAGSSSFSGYSSISYAGFSEGGYADKPTFALVGDSPGGEYMVPAEKLDNFLMNMSQSNAGVGLSLDSSSLQDQIQKAVQSISVPAIPVPVKLSFDPESIKSQLTSILYEIFAEMR